MINKRGQDVFMNKERPCKGGRLICVWERYNWNRNDGVLKYKGEYSGISCKHVLAKQRGWCYRISAYLTFIKRINWGLLLDIFLLTHQVQ